MPRFKPESLTGDRDDNRLETAGTFVATISKSVDYSGETGEWEATSVVFDTEKGSIADRIRSNTRWKFRRLAEALGDDAVDAYTSTDGDGFSMFDPADFVGETVEIVVDKYEYQGKTGVRVERVNRADSFATDKAEGEAIAGKDNGDHKPIPDDDIPF